MTEEPRLVQPEIHEPAAAPAPTEPVAPERRPGAPLPRWRWLVAVLVVALAATATFAGAVLLTGARSASAVARWAPADALVYVELRPDLPGDQRDQLAAFLSAFPGFADRSILEQKLTEVYDRLVSDATKGKQTYSADVAPWFGGQLGVAIGLPTDLSSSASPTGSRPPMVVVASSTDPAKALAWFRSSATADGAAVTTGDVGGTQLLLASLQGESIAAAAPTGVLLVGDEASVRAAIGRNGDGGLAKDADFLSALGAAPADSLATVYVHTSAYAKLIAELPLASGMPTPPADLVSMLPAWSVATIRAGSDALSFDTTAPATSVTTSIADGPSALPARLPASTIALVDAHDAGKAFIQGVAGAGSAARTEVEKALDRVGGLQGLVGWAGETAGVVLKSSSGPLPGLVAVANDQKAAAGLAASLSNLATLAGLKPTDATYAGHTITTVDLGKLYTDASVPPTAGMTNIPIAALSWTLADDLFVAGPGPAFVQAVLDTKPGASLADAERFRSMVGRVASSTQSLAWIDIAAVRDLAVAEMPASERTHYQSDIAPYLAPIAGVVGVATHDGSLERGHGLLILERP